MSSIYLSEGPTGKCAFVGFQIPVALVWVRKDGQPMTPSDYSDAATSSVPALRYTKRIFNSKAEALTEASRLGVQVQGC